MEVIDTPLREQFNQERLEKFDRLGFQLFEMIKQETDLEKRLILAYASDRCSALSFKLFGNKKRAKIARRCALAIGYISIQNNLVSWEKYFPESYALYKEISDQYFDLTLCTKY